jgi:polynucleotide 5'-kinase involved in rRNA processing
MPVTLEERIAYLEGKVEERLKRKGVWNISLSPLKTGNMSVEERLSRLEDILKEYFHVPKLVELWKHQ